MKNLMTEWRNFLSEATAKYSGIIKITPNQEVIQQVKDLQNQIKDSAAVSLPEKAIHVTAVHQSVVKPFRKQLKKMQLPPAPEPILDVQKGIEIKQYGSKKSWAIQLKNQDQMRDYVGQLMELLGNENTNPEPDRVFHISLANLTGNPHDSVR